MRNGILAAVCRIAAAGMVFAATGVGLGVAEWAYPSRASDRQSSGAAATWAALRSLAKTMPLGRTLQFAQTEHDRFVSHVREPFEWLCLTGLVWVSARRTAAELRATSAG